MLHGGRHEGNTTVWANRGHRLRIWRLVCWQYRVGIRGHREHLLPRRGSRQGPHPSLVLERSVVLVRPIILMRAVNDRMWRVRPHGAPAAIAVGAPARTVRLHRLAVVTVTPRKPEPSHETVRIAARGLRQ